MLRPTFGFIVAFMLVLWHIGSDLSSMPPPDPSGCPDGQGINVLPDGDFGSGTSNILFTDPGIAPGYIYTFTPPPNDGFYTITNNTTPWGSFASNWIDIQDNSPDPNGYMMVVNASTAPGVFYERMVDVCGSTEYQFSCDVINLLEPNVGMQILPNIDFLVDGQVLFSTGDIPQDATWQTVGFVFVTTPGQTTASLQIRNNAPGGIGNDLALDNISFFTCGPAITINAPEFVCDPAQISLQASVAGGNYVNPTYQWQQSVDAVNWVDIPGATALDLDFFLNADTYFRLLAADGATNIMVPSCRVVSLTAFVFVGSSQLDIETTICTGESIMVGNEIINSGGIYDILLTSSLGCDSAIHLEVMESAPSGVTITDTICAGEIYLGIAYEMTTTIRDTFLNSSGCDSVRIIQLFVDNPDLIMPQDAFIEQGESFTIAPSASGNIVQWNWMPDTFIDCTTCPIVTVNPAFTTDYFLSVSTSNNCVDSGTIRINVFIPVNIYLPTAFSPNNDGINDDFFPLVNQNIISIIYLRIFDRWGARIYEVGDIAPNNTSLAWDGRIRDQEAQEGVYTYVAEFLAIDGTVQRRAGDVTLIR